MLTITPPAADILAKARARKGAPSDHGVRFYATKEEETGRARLAFKFVAAPKEGDTVLDDAAIEAYVGPDVDRLIGDVTVDVKAEGDEPGLVVRRHKQS
jgi:Fe-S cluster assembly iron-binding protein IscA